MEGARASRMANMDAATMAKITASCHFRGLEGKMVATIPTAAPSMMYFTMRVVISWKSKAGWLIEYMIFYIYYI